MNDPKPTETGRPAFAFWRPIETAPKDDTEIIILFDSATVDIVRLCRWNDGVGCHSEPNMEARGWWSHIHSAGNSKMKFSRSRGAMLQKLSSRTSLLQMPTPNQIEKKSESMTPIDGKSAGDVSPTRLLGCGDWPTMPLPKCLGGDVEHEWHAAINQHAFAQIEAKQEWPRWMYDAKHAASEVPRLALLHYNEREGKLCKTFRRCSCCADQKHVVDNHLTCCLGVECRKCPHLAALDKSNLPPKQRDWIKAWTCVGHILANGGDVAGEGFLTAVDDRMYWDSVHESLASTK